jgi:hypothetical protein
VVHSSQQILLEWATRPVTTRHFLLLRRSEAWTDLDAGGCDLVHPNRVFAFLHFPGNLFRGYYRVTRVVSSGHREVLVLTVSLLSTGRAPAGPAGEIVVHGVVVSAAAIGMRGLVDQTYPLGRDLRPVG